MCLLTRGPTASAHQRPADMLPEGKGWTLPQGARTPRPSSRESQGWRPEHASCARQEGPNLLSQAQPSEGETLGHEGWVPATRRPRAVFPAECPQEREAARPTTATVPDASRRPEPRRCLSRYGQVLAPPTEPGLLPLPAVESSGSRQSCGLPPIGLAAQSTQRGTLEYDCPLRLPRSPQGQYPQPRRGPASSQSTEVGARTAGWRR